MSRLLIAVLALAGCADIGPFRASSSSSGDSSDSGVAGGDAAGDGARDPDATVIAAPEAIATTVDEPLELSVSGGYVFWAELGSSYAVARVAVAGGQVKRLALADVPYLTTTDGLAFWTSTTSVAAVNSALTASTPLATSGPFSFSLAVSADHVYFVRKVSSTWSIERVPRAGGTVEPLYTALTSAPVLGGGMSSLYWLYNGELRRSAFTSPTTYTVEATGVTPSVRVGGATACWVTQPDPNVYSYDVWCQHQGQKTKVSPANPQVFDLAVGDDAVYIAARIDSTTGRIRRYDFATKQLSTPYAASAGGLPTAVAHDASYLYWIESYAVWRQALD
jgi:hypothetical protein